MSTREGSLEAPTRHPLDWKNPDFYDEAKLMHELERSYDICHGCRRCVSLCTAFPTLFDLIDESSTLEVDGVAKADYWKVVDECYLCDLCYMTKCPYVPPHPWNLDFPHTMLRAKAIKFKKGETTFRDKLLSSTDAMGKLASIPVVVQAVNASLKSKPIRKMVDSVLHIHPDRQLPEYDSAKFRSTAKPRSDFAVKAGEKTPGKVAIYATCYVNYNEPGIGHDLLKLLAHNEIPAVLVEKEACCGMPKLELGDLDAVQKLKEVNIPHLAKLAREGYAILTAVPSCTLMYKQELPLMFPARRRRAGGEGSDVGPVRIPDGAQRRRPAEDRFQVAARQGRLSRAVSPAGAEHRQQDARRAAAGRRQGDDGRALLRPRRHLGREVANTSTSR